MGEPGDETTTAVLVGKAGAVHLLVDGDSTGQARDWLLSPPLSELRRSLTTRLRRVMAEADAVRLLLPSVGPVSSRMRFEALLAAVLDVAELERRAPFVVNLMPADGESASAVDVLLSLMKVRATESSDDASSGRPPIRLATEAESAALGASTGRAVAALSGAAVSSAGLAWLGGGALAAGGGGLAAGVGIGLLGMAGPVGLVGAAGAVAYGLFGRKRREQELEERLRGVEQDWRQRVEIAELAIEERHRAEVYACGARIAELEALVAEQALALSELQSRTGTVRKGPELAQPVAFGISLAADPAEPLQRRENLKYAWRLLVRYLGALMLADLERSGRCTSEAAAALQAGLAEKSGEGRWLHLCRVIADLTAPDGSFFDVPLSAWRRKKRGYGTLLAPLDRVKEVRNDETHGSRIPSAGAAERWVAEVLPHWERALEEARPYTSCRLLIVESIVDHTDDGETIYQVRWLVGDRLYPRAERVAWPVRLKRGRLCVLRAGLARPATADDILDVSTFLRWEHSSVLDRPETYGVVGLGDDTLRFGAFRFQDEKALGGTLPEWLAAK